MDAAGFVRSLEQAGFGPFTGVPCSVFTPLIDHLGTLAPDRHYVCTSEGEAMGLAGGFALAGRNPVVYMQNDGLGNAVNPLSSLQLLYRLKALLLVSWRGEPGQKDAPQHRVMGARLTGLLEQLAVPYIVLEPGADALEQALEKARAHGAAQSTPFALIVRKGYFAPGAAPAAVAAGDPGLAPRLDYIRLLAAAAAPGDILLGATGFSGRELQQYTEHPGRFYMMGSMGCLPALGLGLADSHPGRAVYVLDGDGALLMKLGSLATIGRRRPANLVHLLFDNQAYESTGGQPTLAAGVDFCALARACGYPAQESVASPEAFRALLGSLSGRPRPLFVHVRVRCGTPAGLPRPEQPPERMRDDLMAFLG
ncbi:MAG TPA: phosphonopyruvate decarboxylase [Candidatus Aminicenantes bacterium]|nr:phosphonopyruvate decarboxylase [Candidatus Aminicenantes bacterium]